MTDQDPDKKPDKYDYIGYFLALAILTPIGVWLKSNYAKPVGAWVNSWFS